MFISVTHPRANAQIGTSCALEMSGPTAGIYNSPFSVKHHTPFLAPKTKLTNPIGWVLEETVAGVSLKSQVCENSGLIWENCICFCGVFLPYLLFSSSVPWTQHVFDIPSSPISAPPRGKVLKISNSTGLVAVAKACSDKAGWLQHSQHAPGCVCERTGQAGTKKQLCQYCQNGKNKHFWWSCFTYFSPEYFSSCKFAEYRARQICFPANISVFFPLSIFTEVAVN